MHNRRIIIEITLILLKYYYYYFFVWFLVEAIKTYMALLSSLLLVDASWPLQLLRWLAAMPRALDGLVLTRLSTEVEACYRTASGTWGKRSPRGGGVGRPNDWRWVSAALQSTAPWLSCVEQDGLFAKINVAMATVLGTASSVNSLNNKKYE